MPVRKTGIVLDPCFNAHVTGSDCPECPARLEQLFPLVLESPLRESLVLIPAAPATDSDLLEIHSPAYLERMRSTEGGPCRMLDADTYVSGDSNRIALIAAGGLCRAVDAVCDGIVQNAFAFVRPPGHHAERSASMGFCLYNNIAVSARYARKVRGLERVLIVDWDLHHGNGTQHCFEADPAVLFFSTHLQWIFPGSGGFAETGRGEGTGYTINVPLHRGFGDAEYLFVYENLLEPVARAFKPSIILVSAGFDIHRSDPMRGMRVTEEGFAGLTEILIRIAEENCGGRLVMTLEGGYDPSALKSSVREVLRELTGLRCTDTRQLCAGADVGKVNDIMTRVAQAHRENWPFLSQLQSPRVGAARRVQSAISNGWRFIKG
jgi:acetoin utilization deacetylase AcuC-like enzyme